MSEDVHTTPRRQHAKSLQCCLYTHVAFRSISLALLSTALALFIYCKVTFEVTPVAGLYDLFWFTKWAPDFGDWLKDWHGVPPRCIGPFPGDFTAMFLEVVKFPASFGSHQAPERAYSI